MLLGICGLMLGLMRAMFCPPKGFKGEHFWLWHIKKKPKNLKWYGSVNDETLQILQNNHKNQNNIVHIINDNDNDNHK